MICRKIAINNFNLQIVICGSEKGFQMQLHMHMAGTLVDLNSICAFAIFMIDNFLPSIELCLES